MRKLLATTAMTLAILGGAAQAAEVEVLHWWTSGGEAAALDVLKKKLESQGVTWKDMPVAGGGGATTTIARSGGGGGGGGGSLGRTGSALANTWYEIFIALAVLQMGLFLWSFSSRRSRRRA